MEIIGLVVLAIIVLGALTWFWLSAEAKKYDPKQDQDEREIDPEP